MSYSLLYCSSGLRECRDTDILLLQNCLFQEKVKEGYGHEESRYREERNPLRQLPTARSKHLFFKSPKIFRRHRFYIGDPKIGRPGGAPGKHPFFARACNCIHGRDRWDPCAPLLHFPGHTGGSGRSIPFLWWVARQAGTPVICSTTQPYSSASNQTLTGKGMTRGKADRCSGWISQGLWQMPNAIVPAASGCNDGS